LFIETFKNPQYAAQENAAPTANTRDQSSKLWSNICKYILKTDRTIIK